MTFARCCVECARPLAEDADRDRISCPVTGQDATRWHVVNTATGERLALVTRLEGAVAVASGIDFDPEEWFHDLAAHDIHRDAVARAPLPRSPRVSEWPFLTRA